MFDAVGLLQLKLLIFLQNNIFFHNKLARWRVLGVILGDRGEWWKGSKSERGRTI